MIARKKKKKWRVILNKKEHIRYHKADFPYQGFDDRK
jgi:hypothetical protein